MIYDTIKFGEMDQFQLNTHLVSETYLEPESVLGQIITTASGLTLIEQITIILLGIGYRPQEIAKYRGVTRSSVNSVIINVSKKLGI